MRGRGREREGWKERERERERERRERERAFSRPLYMRLSIFVKLPSNDFDRLRSRTRL